MGIIYKIVGPNITTYTSKIYIGSATRDKLQKWNKEYVVNTNPLHIYGYSSHMSALMQRYERNNFDITILEHCKDGMIPSRIVHWIKHYKCMFPYGNNINMNLAPDTLEILPRYISYIVRDINSVDSCHGYIVDYLPADKQLEIIIASETPMTQKILNIAKSHLRLLICEHCLFMCNKIIPNPLPLYNFKTGKV